MSDKKSGIAVCPKEEEFSSDAHTNVDGESGCPCAVCQEAIELCNKMAEILVSYAREKNAQTPSEMAHVAGVQVEAATRFLSSVATASGARNLVVVARLCWRLQSDLQREQARMQESFNQFMKTIQFQAVPAATDVRQPTDEDDDDDSNDGGGNLGVM